MIRLSRKTHPAGHVRITIIHMTSALTSTALSPLPPGRFAVAGKGSKFRGRDRATG